VGFVCVVIGAAGALGARPYVEAWTSKKNDDCCSKSHAPTVTTCPAHVGPNGFVIDDQVEADRVRRAMLDGVFRPWFELGRAPTQDEIGARLKLSAADTNLLVSELQACGEAVQMGILKVPESDIIAVAWPLANVPTGITVTLDGSRTVNARCAVDALGISQMMGKRAVIEATTRDNGAKVRIEVDGDRLVSAEPPGVAVMKGGSCDEMNFFSSVAAIDAWKKDHPNEAAKVLPIEDAVKHGAEIFGRFTRGLTL
jgi:hypothetical protein